MKKADLVVFSIISVLTLLWWQASQQLNMSEIIEYWQYFPNSHRMFSQLLIILHDNPIHFVNLVAGSFLVSLFLTYKILDLKDEPLLIFLLAVGWMVWGGYFVYCAPIYPLLAYLYKNEDWRMVPLIALIKEHAVIIAMFYFIYKKEYRKAVYAALTASVIYVLLFLLIPFNSFGSVAIIVTLEDIILYPRWVFFKSAGFFVVFGLLHPFSTFEKKLILTNIIVILGFGLWWEFQLWMPLVVLFLLHRKEAEEE